MAGGSGRYIRAVEATAGDCGDLAIDATLRAAALRRAYAKGQRRAGGSSSQPAVLPGDLRTKIRERRRGGLVVFVVDASDSMGVKARMAAAKGAVLVLLQGAYRSRDRVALVTFEGDGARLLLPPTSSVALARQRLEALPTGGATPLAAGMYRGWQLIRAERLKDPAVHALLVIISDGEPNVPLVAGRTVGRELDALALALAEDDVAATLIDTRASAARAGCMQRLARLLGGSYRRIERPQAAAVVGALRR